MVLPKDLATAFATTSTGTRNIICCFKINSGVCSVDASAISYDEFMASEVVEDFIRRAQQRKERSSLLL